MSENINTGSYIKSVFKTFHILEAFIDDNNEKGIHELSKSTGIHPSTLQRLVNTLRVKGYLTQNPKTLKYRLGFTFYHLYKSFSQTFNWVDEAKYYMERLVLKYNETTNLAYLEGNNIVYLLKADSSHILRPSFDIGTKYPIHCTALGKCLLAYLPKDFTKKFFSGEQFIKYTDNTIISFSDLNVELDKIRAQGYAIDDEEFQNDLRCVAAPIKNKRMDNIVVASLSITAPKGRMAMERLYVIKDDLIETATAISDLIM